MTDLAHIPACYRAPVLRGLIAIEEMRGAVLEAAAANEAEGSAAVSDLFTRWIESKQRLLQLRALQA